MIYTEKTLPSVFLEAQKEIFNRAKGKERYNAIGGFIKSKQNNSAKYVIFDTPYTVRNVTYNIKSVVYYTSRPGSVVSTIEKKVLDGNRSLGSTVDVRIQDADLSKRIIESTPILFSFIQLDDYVVFENKTFPDDTVRMDHPSMRGKILVKETDDNGNEYYRVMIPQTPSFTYEDKPYYALSATDFQQGLGEISYTLRQIGYSWQDPDKRYIGELQRIPYYLDLPISFRRLYENLKKEKVENDYNRQDEVIKSFFVEYSQYYEWRNNNLSPGNPNITARNGGLSTKSVYGISNIWDEDYNPYDNILKSLWTRAFEAVYDNEVLYGSDPTLAQQVKITPKNLNKIINGGEKSTVVSNNAGFINKNGALNPLTKDETISGRQLRNIEIASGGNNSGEETISSGQTNNEVTTGTPSIEFPNFPNSVGNPDVKSPFDDVAPETSTGENNSPSEEDSKKDETPTSPFKEGTASVVPPDSSVSLVKGTMTFQGENKEGDSTWGVMTTPGAHFILDEKGNAKIKAAPPVDTDLTMGNVEIASEHGTRINVGTSLKIDVNQSGKHKEETTMSSSGSQSSTKIYYPAFSINVSNGGLDITCENGNISFLGKNIIMNATENLHLNGTRSLGLFSSFTGSTGAAFGVAKKLGSLFGFELPVGGGGEIIIKGGKLNMDVTTLKDSASQRQSKTGAAKTSEVGSSNAVDAIDSAADINLSTSGNVRISAGQKVRIEAQNWPINTSNPLTIPPVWQIQQLPAFELAANVLGPPAPPGIPGIQFSSWNAGIRSNVTGIGGITLGTQVGSISMYTGKVIPFDVVEGVPSNILLSSGLGSITQQAGLGIYQKSGLSLKAFTPAGALDIINGFKTSTYSGIKWQDIKGAKFDTTLGFDKTSKLGAAFEFDAGAFAKLDGAVWAKRGFGFASQSAPAMSIDAEGAYKISAGGTVSINAGGALNVSAAGAIGLLAGGAAVLSGALTTVVASGVLVQLAGPLIRANGEDLTIDNIGII